MYLPIGIKVRELDGSALLAFEAAERGWGVILGNKGHLKGRTDLPRGMQIEKKIAAGAAMQIANIWEMGRKVSAWCEEGLVYPNAEEYGWRKIERKAYDHIELFFAWGQNQADDMAKIGCNSEKMVITGNPRFDLHRAELRAVFDKDVERIKKRFAPFILVNTKFSLHNGTRTSDDIVAKMRDQKKVQTSAQEEEMAGAIAFHKGGFEKFVELTETLSRRFPNHTIVVRPHPSERFETWGEETVGLPNVKVIREGNVVEWILASEISIHNNCTTGVESYLLGKTAISYRPVRDPRYDLYLPNALSVNTADVEHTADLVEKALRGDAISTDSDASGRAKVARHFIANVDGKSACANIMDALHSLDLPEERLSFSTGRLKNLGVAAQREFGLLKRAVLHRDSPFAALVTKQARYPRKRVPERHRVYAEEIVELLGIMRGVTGRFGNVRVSEIEPNVLCIH